MNIEILIFSLCFIISSCSQSKKNEKQEIDDIGINMNQHLYNIPDVLDIDLKSEYSKIQMKLEDVADIQYIPLETTSNVLLMGINNIAMSKDKIVLCDKGLDKIFIFNRKGEYISSFNCRGGGPTEYRTIYNFCVDFDHEEVYICDYQLNYRILVYSFKGHFLRKLKFSEKVWPEILYNYDKDYLICYDSYKLDDLTSKINEYPYLLINKKTGGISHLPIRIKNRIGNGFISYNGNITQYSKVNIEPMIKTENGVIISDFGKDTIFSYFAGKLSPIAIRSNMLASKEVSYLSTISIISHRYLFFNIINKQIDKQSRNVLATEPRSLLYDKKNKSIYEAEVSLADIVSNKSMQWNSYNMDLPDNCFIRVLPADLLLTLLDKNRLNGKLKKVASILREDANPVLMIANFKE